MGQGILEFPKFVIAEFRHCEALKKEGAISSKIPSKFRHYGIPFYLILKKKGILELRILEFPSKIKLNILAYHPPGTPPGTAPGAPVPGVGVGAAR